ncbi:MAG: hypothetical protein K2Q03_08695 [Sphingobacteriaceae bacterium]|nr:hypothetical protein [Flavobacteriaceae bacterium]MBY0245514.1 hypothetical protein [Sphingobacteriaceae bacterium]
MKQEPVAITASYSKAGFLYSKCSCDEKQTASPNAKMLYAIIEYTKYRNETH